MPYDSTQKVIWGPDALTPEKWARKTFCDWLMARLNDAEGPYAAPLGLTAEREAIVTDNGQIAKAMYDDENSPPVVSVMQGPVDGIDFDREIAGATYKGRHIDLQCILDMGVRDAQPNTDNVAMQRADDSNLAGFVADAVRRGFNPLNLLGLFNCEIEPDTEKQRAGQGRHPMQLTFFIQTLDDWTPL